MAYIKEITYEVASTIKIRNYEYAKPRISVTIALKETDDEEAIFDELTATVRSELKKEVAKLTKMF